MAPLVLVLLVLVAVALVGVSLRALFVASEAMRLIYRLKLAAHLLADQASSQHVSGPLAPLQSCYPPIRVLYSTKHAASPGE
jgi:hypothetical protein